MANAGDSRQPLGGTQPAAVQDSDLGPPALARRINSLSAAWPAAVTDLSQRVEPEEAPAGRAAEKYKGRRLAVAFDEASEP